MSEFKPDEHVHADDASAVEANLKALADQNPLAPGTERRIAVEKKMKRKLDARCSLFVLIYILNYLDRECRR